MVKLFLCQTTGLITSSHYSHQIFRQQEQQRFLTERGSKLVLTGDHEADASRKTFQPTKPTNQTNQPTKPTNQIKVEVRISVVKLLHAKLIVKYYDYTRSKPEVIINGWKESGITKHLEMIDLDPFSSKVNQQMSYYCNLYLLIKGRVN